MTDSYCALDVTVDDPFPASAAYPKDTKAYYSIDLSEMGGGTEAGLLDVCSYLSQQPNSDPSDCVVIPDSGGALKIAKDVVPDDPTSTWSFGVTGPTPLTIPLNGDSASVFYPVTSGTYDIAESALAPTSLSQYDTTWNCSEGAVVIASGTGTSISDLPIGNGDIVTCAFTNTRNTGSLTIHKTLDDGGSGFRGDFAIDYDCDDGTVHDGTVYLAGGESQTISNIPTGTQCTVSEPTLPTAPTGYSWGTPVITGSPATIVTSPTAEVTVANSLTMIPVEITVCKDDTEGDPIAGWGVSLDDDAQETGADGCYTWPVTEPGTYTASEEARTGWTPQGDTTHDFVVVPGSGPFSHTFVNFQNVDITACKIKTNDQTVVPDWPVYLITNGQAGGLQYTGTDGCCTWTITEPGTYGVGENVLPFWTPVGDTSYDFGAVTSGSGPYSHTFYNYREPGCSLTQGYWNTHSEFGPAPEDPGWYNIGDVDGDTSSEGPNEEFFDSGQTWYETFMTKVKGGNAYYILAHQYMAAMLNVANGADPTVLGNTLADAEALLDYWDTVGPNSIPRNSPDRQTAIELADILDDFNNGLLPGGPGHCDTGRVGGEPIGTISGLPEWMKPE